MKKKAYVIPQTLLVDIEFQRLLTGSQFDVQVNDPTDEVNAEEALSRKGGKLWDEFQDD